MSELLNTKPAALAAVFAMTMAAKARTDRVNFI
jgi:hypothetical protein